KTSTSCRIGRRCVDAIGYFTVRDDGIREAAAETAVRGRERLASIARNHHAVVVSAYVDHVRTRWMDRDGIDLELTRSRNHPRVGIAAVLGEPKTFSSPCEDDSRNRRMLQNRAGAARLRRNALHLAPA